MFETILNSLKGELTESLNGKLGLNSPEIDKIISSSKGAFEKTVARETENNGVETLLNLFSTSENSNSSDKLLKTLGTNLLSSLTSNGFSSGAALSIKKIVLPIVINMISKNINGDSKNLSHMLKPSGLTGVAKNKGAGFIKGLFK